MKKVYNVSSPIFTDAECLAVNKVLKSGWITSGKVTINFEKKLEQYLGSNNVLAVNSCTNALVALLKLLDLKKNDEVLTSSFTYVSMINSLFNAGLKIKLVDIDIKDYNICLSDLKKKISNKTKCILFTNYGGYPNRIHEIIKLSKKFDCYLIEDAATSLGSSYKNKKIGSFNKIFSIFSFHANKIISTAEGGAISFNEEKYKKQLKKIIWNGVSKDSWSRTNSSLNFKYDVDIPGYKMNYTDLQASIGIIQLKRLDKLIKHRKVLKNRYLNNLSILQKKHLISFRKENKNLVSAEYNFTILVNTNKLNSNRDDLFEHLRLNSIFCSVHYIPSHKFKFYKKKFTKEKLPNTNYIYENILSLPFHNNLTTKDIDYISKIIINYILKNKK